MLEATSPFSDAGRGRSRQRRDTRPALREASSEEVYLLARQQVEQVQALRTHRPLSMTEWTAAWERVVDAQERAPHMREGIHQMKVNLVSHYPLLVKAQHQLEEIRLHRDHGLLGEVQTEALALTLERLEREVRQLEQRSGPLHQIDAYLRRLHTRLEEERRIIDQGKQEQAPPKRMDHIVSTVMRPRRRQEQEQVTAARLLRETQQEASVVRTQLLQRLNLPKNEIAPLLTEMAQGTYRMGLKMWMSQKAEGIKRWWKKEPALPPYGDLVSKYHRLSVQGDEFMAVKQGKKNADPAILDERWWQ